MAVSGRNISDFHGPFSRGSAEEFEHCCDPCLSEDQHVEAYGYCLDCGEYLCNNCFRSHKKTKASRHHQLLSKDNMDKRSTSSKPVHVCTEKCSIHRNEVIKFFCPKHEEIGCTDCMTLNHKPCDIDYIPDKCAGIGDSDEYMEILKELDQKMKETEAALKTAAAKNREIDDSHDRIIKEIDRKGKEINDHLETIRKKSEADASKKKAISKQEVKAVISSCTNFTANIRKMQVSLQRSQKAVQNGQLFIDIKRAKSELQSIEIQQAEISLGTTSTQFTFNTNKDLDNILEVQSFGELTELKVAADAPSNPIKTHASKPLQDLAARPRSKGTFNSLQRKTYITDAPSKPIKTRASKPLQNLAARPRSKGTFNSLQRKTDINFSTQYCYVTGCVALSSSKLVLADYNSLALLVLNPERKNVLVEEKQLDSWPWDIAVLPQDQIAVTMPINKQILVMTTEGELSTDRIIPVTGECNGIIYHQNCLYVLCWNPCSIHVLDIDGNIKNKILLACQAAFSNPHYIVLSQDQSKFYVSDFGNYTIASVTLQGEVSAVYKHKDLRGPWGMLVLDDGSLLVCCFYNHIIHHVSADWKQGRTVMEGFEFPRSICYSADRSHVYIGGVYGDLAVCSVIYKA